MTQKQNQPNVQGAGYETFPDARACKTKCTWQNTVGSHLLGPLSEL